MPSIAVDVMSGDSGAPECIPGALRALVTDPALELILVGDPTVIEPALAHVPPAVRARLSVHPAATVVGMSEHPREAIRRRKDSSMRIAIDLVKEGRAGAMISAGNTGALTAMAHFVLKTVGPVERAPIMSSIPARNGGHTHILDLGANTKATALQLAQFATMGSIVARDVFGIATPRVGLLNIGEEDTKGHELIQEAHELIRASGVNYLGFVEGNHIFDENVDVVVTDGFTGNIALKTAEGTAKLVGSYLRQALKRSLLSKLGAVIASGALATLRRKLDPRTQNGGVFLGLNGIVVKAHGSADAVGFASAVDTAIDMARNDINARISTDRSAIAAESAGAKVGEL